MTRTLLLAVFLTFGTAVFTTANAQECEGTPFACAVDDAINAGLQHFRNLERGAGHFTDNNGRHNFLGALSFLEKRQLVLSL